MWDSVTTVLESQSPCYGGLHSRGGKAEQGALQACPDEAQVAAAAPSLVQLAAVNKAQGTENFVVRSLAAFEDEAAISEYIAANCATEHTTGALTVSYLEMMGFMSFSHEPAAALAGLTLCTNADGVGTEWFECAPKPFPHVVLLPAAHHSQFVTYKRFSVHALSALRGKLRRLLTGPIPEGCHNVHKLRGTCARCRYTTGKRRLTHSRVWHFTTIVACMGVSGHDDPRPRCTYCVCMRYDYGSKKEARAGGRPGTHKHATPASRPARLKMRSAS